MDLTFDGFLSSKKEEICCSACPYIEIKRENK